ncbi:MAG: glycosyltransferase family 2 protein, partial [Nitrospirota bacterium]|nr:glycosyltransferase family 2 protein [Nitrospirota bacterium]
SFQQVRFLRAAIDSILAQDYRPLEVLVMDGGSTDGSVDILKTYGDKISYCSGPDGGQCNAINTGLNRSRGEIVAWLNSDDFYYQGAIAKAVEALQGDPEAALVYGEGNLVSESGEIIRRFPETVPFNLWRLSNHSDYILQPTVFFRREAVFACGLLDEGLHWGLDWDLWIRIGKRFPFVYHNDVLAASRIYGETKTATGGYRRLREIIRILSRHNGKKASPAAVAHTIITLIRGIYRNEQFITSDVMTNSLPKPFQKAGAPVIMAIECSLRKWLQNIQGFWQDGLVGRNGKLWIPSDGQPCQLEIKGRNLGISGQLVTLCSGGNTVGTERLSPGEEFRLSADIQTGEIPIKVELVCEKTCEVKPLDPRFGVRRAGFCMTNYQLTKL